MAILSSECLLPRVKHFLGLPPELSDGEDTRQELGPARFLVTEEGPDGVFLYRYSIKGECVGDTWHQSVDDAKHQATYEYEGLVGEWFEVSPQIVDVVNFGLAQIDQSR